MKYLLVLLPLLLVGCSDGGTKVQQEGSIDRQLFYYDCRDVPEVYYPTQRSTNSYLNDTKGLLTFWDSRYGNNVTHNCYSSVTTTNTPIEFGGPQATLISRIGGQPWVGNKNLMVQLYMDTPMVDGNVHGGVSINFFIQNLRTSERLNYVISLYTLGVARDYEVQDILYDPTTDTRFVSTTILEGNTYTTISPISNKTNDVGSSFFRVTITRDNLPVANADEWGLLFIGIQSEIEESISNGSVSLEFRDFTVYTTDGIL